MTAPEFEEDWLSCEKEVVDAVEVWVCGRNAEGGVWEILGVYADREAAVKRCRIPRRDFIAPLPLNADLPEETMTWPGCEYPLIEYSVSAVDVQADGLHCSGEPEPENPEGLPAGA